MDSSKIQETFSEEELQFIKNIFGGTDFSISSTHAKWTEGYETYEMKILPPGSGYIIRYFEVPDRAMPHPITTEYRSKEHALYWFINNRLPRGVYEKNSKEIQSFLAELENKLKKQKINVFDYVEK